MFYEFLPAVVGSIEKWRGKHRDEYGWDCPLCEMVGYQSCLDCPVHMKVKCELGIHDSWDGGACFLTPFWSWVLAEGPTALRLTAFEEVRYLEELFDDLYCIETMGGII